MVIVPAYLQVLCLSVNFGSFLLLCISHSENGHAGIIVTHDLRMCQFVNRVLQMQAGTLVRVYETKDEIMKLAMGTVMH
jgi:ABC-type dipeptide/oligopeptide/nickel transport system ATPase subunit